MFFSLGRLNDADTLFVNTSADVGFFCRDDYMPIFVNNITFPNASFAAVAAETCGPNIECLFDVAATLSTEFGQTTLNNSATIETDNQIIGKKRFSFTRLYHVALNDYRLIVFR